MELILENPQITQDKIAGALAMSKNGVRYVMEKLKEKGLLMRKGSTKKGIWIINCEGLEGRNKWQEQ